MAGSNLEIVRGLFTAFEAGDAVGMVDPLSPDLVFHVRDDEPDAAVHQGIDATAGVLANWLETFPELSVEDLSLQETGDWVIASFVLHGRGGTSGAVVSEPYSWACRLVQSKVVEIREYKTAEEALAAIG